ncbi:MAG: transcription termination factor Rho [Akkermansiaceae bacterium]|nr:transcription termination factor Rho [Akkermansiaceae bacterium]
MNTDAPSSGKAERTWHRGRSGADESRRESRRSYPRAGLRDARTGASQPSKRTYVHKNKRRGGGSANPRHTAAGKEGDAASQQQQQQEPSRAYVPVGEPTELTGLLEITSKGFGFMRVPSNNWAPSLEAVYVPADIIAEHHLRPFSKVCGMAQKYERGHQLISVKEVNGLPPEQAAQCPHFDDLKAVNPTERISFETYPERYTTRTLDLVAPVARGQRGLIVAPPRTGKTTLLLHIAEAVLQKYAGDIHLLVLLVDERPEEVTEFKRALPGAEIFASSNDSGIREHCRMAEMCITYAKRLMESGKHVLVLMDSITRLARAYNNAEKGSGRTMSGGIDARALETPRMLFAAARNTRQAGSITILATALIETNSRMDELIFQEFKGTGNMELVLNRRIAELYIYPAVDILRSGTRREELILPPWMLEKMHLIRRAFAGYKPPEAMERLLFFLKRCSTNAQMLTNLKTR